MVVCLICVHLIMYISMALTRKLQLLQLLYILSSVLSLLDLMLHSKKQSLR